METIMGILNGDDYQIVYSDTPGIIDPKYKLQEGMMKFVGTALSDADLILLVIDCADKVPFHSSTLEKLKKTNVPVFVVLNKYDLVGNEGVNVLFEQWSKELPDAKVFPVSALEKIHTRELLDQIIKVQTKLSKFFLKALLISLRMK